MGLDDWDMVLDGVGRLFVGSQLCDILDEAGLGFRFLGWSEGGEVRR